MSIRTGYNSEQTRTEAFKEIINDADYLNRDYKKILVELAIAFYGDKEYHGLIGQELSDKTGIPVHTVHARLHELRKKDWVVNGIGEKAEKKPVKKLNKISDKMNIVWIINIAMLNKKTELSLFPETT